MNDEKILEEVMAKHSEYLLRVAYYYTKGLANSTYSGADKWWRGCGIRSNGCTSCAEASN